MKRPLFVVPKHICHRLRDNTHISHRPCPIGKLWLTLIRVPLTITMLQQVCRISRNLTLDSHPRPRGLLCLVVQYAHRIRPHLLCFAGETQWEAPEGFGEAASSADGASAAGGGWTAHVDESSGATYYYNADTGETTWEVPAELQQAEVASQGSSTVSVHAIVAGL